MRGGETREGKRIWNPQDSIGTKVSNTLGALIATGSPGSIKQFQRLYLSGTGQLDQYNRGYKFLNELYKRIRAAEELGMNKRKIRQIVGERYTDTERNNILKNRFTPLKVSSFVYDKVKSNALQKGTSDPSRLIKFQTNKIYRSRTN